MIIWQWYCLKVIMLISMCYVQLKHLQNFFFHYLKILENHSKSPDSLDFP